MSFTFTPDQKEALRLDRHVFIEAGAGSGKTAILVQRYLRILEENPDLDMRQILAITFTQKAAQEMKARILDALMEGGPSHQMSGWQERALRSLQYAQITTIHGYCKGVLQQYAIEMGLDPHVRVLAPVQSASLIQSAISQGLYILKRDEDAHLAAYLQVWSVGYLRQALEGLFEQREQLGELVSPEEALLDDPTTRQAWSLTQSLYHVFQQCVAAYQTMKRQASQLDYGDLLLMTSQLLSSQPKVCEAISSDLKFVMVDEFQDTDPLQWSIIRQLTFESGEVRAGMNLFLVGDHKQAIYSFRGTDAALFDATRSEFGPLDRGLLVSLQDNFRAYSPLLSFLNPFFDRVFAYDTKTPIRYSHLVARQDGPAAVGFCFLDGSDPDPVKHELQTLVGWLVQIKKESPDYRWSDMAVLVRTKQHLPLLQSLLKRAGVPSQIYNPDMDLDHAVVQDVQNLIQFILAPHDSLSGLAVLKSVLFGVTEDTVHWLYQVSPDADLLGKCDAFLAVSDRAKYGLMDFEWDHLERFVSVCRQWHSQILCCPLSEVLSQALIEMQAYVRYVSGEGQQLLQWICGAIRDWENSKGLDYEGVQDYIYAVLSSQSFHSVVDDQVQLMTVHASKGLEFPVVFLAECGRPYRLTYSDPVLVHENQLGLSFQTGPDSKNKIRSQIQATLRAQALEEEKRIFYVACTRAKQRLYFLGTEPKGTMKPSFLQLIQVVLDVHDDHVVLEEGPFRQYYPVFQGFSMPVISEGDVLSVEESDVVLAEPQVFEPAGTAMVTTSRFLADQGVAADRLKAQLERLNSGQARSSLVASDYGTVCHLAIEQLWQEPDLSVLLPTLSQTVSLSEPHSKRLKRGLTQFQASEMYASILAADEAYHEWPFTVKLDGRVVEGRFDTVFRIGSHWTIVDYKTTALKGRPETEVAAQYDRQLAVYCEALSLIVGSACTVSSQIVFI